MAGGNQGESALDVLDAKRCEVWRGVVLGIVCNDDYAASAIEAAALK